MSDESNLVRTWAGVALGGGGRVSVAPSADEVKQSGLIADPDLGQHFLRSVDTAKRLADLVYADYPGQVIEVGAGLGTLSEALCNLGINLWAIEIDGRLEPVLRQRLARFGSNARVTISDFLDIPLGHLTEPAALVSILPFDPELARRILDRAFDDRRGVSAGVVVSPDEPVSFGLQVSKIGEIEPDHFWPPPSASVPIWKVLRS